ncbi:hypothetical protein B0H10DRAFT_1776203, partial [Mycena sp. CBHHK59/15]
VMARVARDILAIPDVNISVECLSDARSFMTAETVSLDIVTKEWLRSGLSKGVNYVDFIKIHK